MLVTGSADEAGRGTGSVGADEHQVFVGVEGAGEGLEEEGVVIGFNHVIIANNVVVGWREY